MTIDYGQVHKNYAEEFKTEKRYSPAHIVSTSLRIILREPLKKRISTNHIERQNLTMRMNMRRLTRLQTHSARSLKTIKPPLLYISFIITLCVFIKRLELHLRCRQVSQIAFGHGKSFWALSRKCARWHNIKYSKSLDILRMVVYIK